MVEDIYPFYHECQDSRLEISTFTFHPKYMQNQALNSTQFFFNNIRPQDERRNAWLFFQPVQSGNSILETESLCTLVWALFHFLSLACIPRFLKEGERKKGILIKRQKEKQR